MPNASAPLGVGRRMVNLSENVQAPAHALPVIVFVDEFQQLMSAPVAHGSTREALEVVI